MEVHVLDTIQDGAPLPRPRGAASAWWCDHALRVALLAMGGIVGISQTLPEAPRQPFVNDLDQARAFIASSDFRAAEPLLRAYLGATEASAEAHSLLGYTLMRLNQPRSP